MTYSTRFLAAATAVGLAYGCSVVNAPDAPADPAGDGGSNTTTTGGNGGSGGNVSCTSPEVDCGGTCADTMTDAEHCGGCGNACAQGGFCVNAECRADCGTLLECGNVCADILVDPLHCGGCNNACGTMAVCTGGNCVACASTELICNGVCTDVSSDDMNCGGCGVPCTSPEVCIGSSCGPAIYQDCDDLKTNAPNAQSGNYMIDPNGGDPGDAFQVYCDMQTDGGGWTECYSLVNTQAEDINCSLTADQNWFHQCVDWTMASWSGSEIMVQLRQNNTDVYSGWATRTNTWTYANLTSPNAANSQFNRLTQHPNAITLNTGHLFTMSAFNGDNGGWGGSWGNGYVMAVSTSACYACNVVLSVMGFRNTAANSSPCNNRSFTSMDAGHEIMYEANGGVTTNTNAALTPQQKFIGEMKFFVR